ncbi:hypothetical protein ACKVMQ_14050, partial [Faecalibacterium hattorii]
ATAPPSKHFATQNRLGYLTGADILCAGGWIAVGTSAIKRQNEILISVNSASSIHKNARMV